MAKKTWFLIGFSLLVVMVVRAQELESGTTSMPEFKPRYAGMSVNTGMIFTSVYGPAFFLAPSLNFQITPRLFVNTGVGIAQYSLLPSASKLGESHQSATSMYIFAEGVYLLNDRWSINGHVMKNISPSGQFREVSPYYIPSEAMHIGVDYKLTPNVTIGARFGYSNGGYRNNPFDF